MKPRNYCWQLFRHACEKIAGENFTTKFDSDGKNLVVYSEHRAVFTIARREVAHDSPELFNWQILVPIEKLDAIFPEVIDWENKLIHTTVTPKGQQIFWMDDNSASGLFLAEFNLGGKIFYEEVIPCQEELHAIARDMMAA